MGYTLTITVGGLCMLVQRQKAGEEGLYILMPETKHPHMLHCPVMITEAANTPGGKAMLVPLKVNEDLGKLAPHASVKAPRPNRVLLMSEYAAAKVNPDIFTSSPPANLARKIRLPLGSTMVDEGCTADLLVPETVGAGAGGFEILPFVGVVVVTVGVTSTEPLTIGGVTLAPSPPEKPGDPSTLAITILHVPRAEWMCQRTAAKLNETATHIGAYYDLLAAGAKRTVIKHAQVHHGSGGPPVPPNCPTKGS